ncbi:class II fumarate hydratase [Parendozoicomonas haliclonae]|uniref:Fumarate hydratase class II n=1 Tax=Parendozoicomonas haliclonae TaxID=1960125 RepID=A0A1X7AEA2_9GAMM|nr:class II fumarate hydratase [Parendozoicomonas haliclonae]SMA32813.1 Fumarate hydratase class II [Parendozoicomonas haliclonae]
MNTRTESDSMGELELPADALYGPQTQRAINNFPVSGQPMPEAFIRALITVKIAAAESNRELGLVEEDIAEAIIYGSLDLLQSNDLMKHFPVDIFQTGSGTSTNMNANEVIAHLASERLGRPVSPNDHVNYGQSSNDVIPTTIHASAAIELNNALLPALSYLITVIHNKADVLDGYVKTGRTHLMDAMPVRLSQSLTGWADQLQSGLNRLATIQDEVLALAQGGTAVGTGINAHPDFARTFCQHLSVITSLEFHPAENFFSHLSSQDTVVALSGQLKTLAVSIMKIANDLRWMNSGPLAGFGEIELEALQPGSSIMPGKVNPVIPESAAMVAAQVIGNDTAITLGGQAGNFELNVMLPMIASNLLSSIQLLSNTCRLLADKAIATFTVNGERLREALDRNPILVTALNPIIGYRAAAEIAKQAYKQKRPVIDVAEEMTEIAREELENLLDPRRLTEGGITE